MRRHDHSPGTWLTEADRQRFAAALAAAREAGVYRRLEALLLVAEGHSVTEAARRRCRCGYLATNWMVPLLAHDLAAKGLADSPQTLRRRLHEAGYRWKRPRYVYVERAPHLPQEKGGSPDV